MPFEFFPTRIKDVILIKPKVFEDKRGFFLENYKFSDFVKNNIPHKFVQDNISSSRKNVLRGLHFQKAEFAQAKLICVLEGKIQDVAVDLRIDSPTFGQYTSKIISSINKHQLYIPEGFAHGFLTLSKTAIIQYKTSREYAPNHDSGIIWNDKDIHIDWQLTETPILSEKDKKLQELKDL